MDFVLTRAQQDLSTEIGTFARDRLTPGAAERDQAAAFSRELWLECGERCLQGLFVPVEYGGRGLDPVSTVVALEALGYGSADAGLNFAICAHLLACVVPIWKHGSEEQKRALLPALSNGTLIAANAMTEPASGSDAFALTTRAERVGDSYRINGTKTFASNAPVADLVVTYVLTDASKGYHGGVTAFIVSRAQSGFRTGRPISKLGLRTSPMSEVIFENTLIPANAMLGGEGGGAPIFAESMDWERICLGAIHVGSMRRLLESAVNFARTTKNGSEVIARSQGVSHPIAEMKVRLEASRMLLFKAASLLDNARNVSMDGAIAKLFVSESYVAAAQSYARIVGAAGVIEGHEAERALRDSLASTIYSGTSEIQKNIIARWLGLPA